MSARLFNQIGLRYLTLYKKSFNVILLRNCENVNMNLILTEQISEKTM